MLSTCLADFVQHQIKNMLLAEINVQTYIENTVSRTEYAYSKSCNKYYKKCDINPYHSNMYCIFLSYLANEMYNIDGDGRNAEKVYYLNKIINGVDIFYEVNLPQIWGCEHPVGSVIGRATIGDKLFIYQGCTIGESNFRYPSIGNRLIMYSNSKVLGSCKIGDNVILSANSYVIDTDIPNNSIVFGQGRDIVIKKISIDVFKEKTKHIWNYD